jgi:hypothetical protein
MRKMIFVRAFILAAASMILTQISPSSMAVSTTPSASCTTNCVITFTYTGDYYSWTVPAGVFSIAVDAQGAAGGPNWATAVLAGKGGRVQANLTTTPGEALYFYVGGTGSQATPSSNVGTGGWNGGGLGGTGNGTAPTQASGTGGGGASDIRSTIGDLSSRIIVAAGGGGSAKNGGTSVDSGGDGGGLTGASSAGSANGSSQATGGTQVAGGTGNKWQVSWNASSNGSFGIGSDAGIGTGGGGGGGGYYGGAGGSWTGGGGGSSWVNASRTSGVTHSSGFRAGNGLITITYSQALPVITTSISGDLKKVSKGNTFQLVANVDQAGKVTFTSNGKRIAGCIGISTAGGNVTCNWKPAVQGSTSIIASIFQSGILKSSSTALNLVTVIRTGTR